MRWAAIMGLDDLLAKLQREAGTPGTPEHTGGVPAKPLPLLGCTLGTPGTPQNSNSGENSEPGHARPAEIGKSLTRPYVLEVLGVPGVQACIGKAFAGTPSGTREVPRVPAKDRLPAIAAEPIERKLERSGGERTDYEIDDRRFCTQCLNLCGAVCIAAKPGGIVRATVGYRPRQGVLLRCAGYSPNASDTDQRPGRERWPGLTYRGSRHADH